MTEVKLTNFETTLLTSLVNAKIESLKTECDERVKTVIENHGRVSGASQITYWRETYQYQINNFSKIKNKLTATPVKKEKADG